MRSTFRSHSLMTLAVAIVSSLGAQAQDGPGPGPRGDGPGCDLFPAPATVGASIGLEYFGPPPSDVNPSLVGPVQLLRSGQVDVVRGTVTLPLYKGRMKKSGKTVWYILTDTDDEEQASFLGLNFSTKLKYSAGGARTANFDNQGNLIFDEGRVDFRPERDVLAAPAPQPFPPKVAKPGSVADARYSPLVRVLNAGGIHFNAPVVAFGVDEAEINFPEGNVDYSRVHDQVVAIDPPPPRAPSRFS